MTNIIQKALEVGKRVPVFPCNSQKRPACRNGFKAATQDPEEIERLFSSPNASLIGMPTGALTGVSVIDIDVHDDKKGEEWRKKNAPLLGDTRVARTKSGGYHFYYLHEDGIRNSQGIDGCVDIRGEGGYVIHPVSDGYEWLNEEPIAPFPDLFRKKPKTAELYLASPVTLSNSQMSQLRDSYEGHGWNKLVSTLCYSAFEKGWSNIQFCKFIAPICDQGDIDPDLGPIMKSIRKTRGTIDTGDKTPINFIEKVKIPLQPIGMIDLNKIPSRQIIYGLDYIAGAVSLTVAAGGVGKSTLVIFEACEIATQGHKVILMMLEDDPNEVKRRVKACIMHHGFDERVISENLVTLSREFRLSMADLQQNKPVAVHADDLGAAMKRFGAKVLIVDPFVQTHQLNENDNGQINFVADRFRTIAKETNSAVMLVHHARKGSEQGIRGENARGASALKDAARSVRELHQISECEAGELNIDLTQAHEIVRIDHTKANYTCRADRRYMRKTCVCLVSAPLATSGQTVATIEKYTPETYEEIVKPAHRKRLLEMVDAARIEEKPYVQNPRAGSRNIYNDASVELCLPKALIKRMVSDLVREEILQPRKLGRCEVALAVVVQQQ